MQDRLSHLHRGEQLRQIIEQVQDAERGRRWSDAVVLLQQARKLDTEDAFNLDERLQNAHEENSQQQRVSELWKRADDARNFGDLAGARDYLGQALQIDSRNTELQNAYSDLLREPKRQQQQLRLGELLRNAREEKRRQHFTEAISYLHEAAEIDPAHPEVQSQLTFAMSRQKEEQRPLAPDLNKSDVQQSLDQEDSGPAEDHVTRLLETLPADGLPVKLQSEVEAKKQGVDIEQEVMASISKLGLLGNPNVGADSTKRSQIPQQPLGETEVENGLTLPFSEALLKAQLGEAPSIRGDLSRELRAKQDELTARAKSQEIQAAGESAVTACDAEMAATTFHCLRSLDDLEKQHPGNGTLAAAIKTSESTRRQKATQLLRESIQGAQQQLKDNSAQRTEETLKEVEFALPDAALNVRNDWKRLKAESAAPLRPKQPASTSAIPAKPGKVGLYAMGATIGVVTLLAVGKVSHLRHRTPALPKSVVVGASAAAASVATSTNLEINASPWAKVMSVQDKSGKSIALSDKDSTTPLRLDGVDSGIYEVTLAGPDSKQQTVECLVSTNEHLCSADMGSPSVKKVLMGEQP